MSSLSEADIAELFRQARIAELHLSKIKDDGGQNPVINTVTLDTGDDFVLLPEFKPPPEELMYRSASPTFRGMTPLQPEETGWNNTESESEMTDDGMFARTASCKHINVTETDDGNVCIACGKVIGHTVDLTPEWRFYGSNDTRFSADPARVAGNHQREYKSITETDLLPLGIPHHVAIKANQIFRMMSVNKPFRGKSGRHDSAIFACVYGAYHQLGNPLPPEMINKYFRIERGAISRGVKEYIYVMKLRGIDLKYVTVPALICPILLELYNTHKKWYSHIEHIAHRLLQLSYEVFHRSSPQSVATGLIFWYLTQYKPIDVKIPTLLEFSEFTNLSNITINKFVKEIRLVSTIKGWDTENPDHYCDV